MKSAVQRAKIVGEMCFVLELCSLEVVKHLSLREWRWETGLEKAGSGAVRPRQVLEQQERMIAIIPHSAHASCIYERMPEDACPKFQVQKRRRNLGGEAETFYFIFLHLFIEKNSDLIFNFLHWLLNMDTHMNQNNGCRETTCKHLFSLPPGGTWEIERRSPGLTSEHLTSPQVEIWNHNRTNGKLC